MTSPPPLHAVRGSPVLLGEKRRDITQWPVLDLTPPLPPPKFYLPAVFWARNLEEMLRLSLEL